MACSITMSQNFPAEICFMLEINRLSRENFPKQTPKKEKQFIWKEQCFLAPGFVFTFALLSSVGHDHWTRSCVLAVHGKAWVGVCMSHCWRWLLLWRKWILSWLVQSSWAVLEEIDISNPTGLLVACLWSIVVTKTAASLVGLKAHVFTQMGSMGEMSFTNVTEKYRHRRRKKY